MGEPEKTKPLSKEFARAFGDGCSGLVETCEWCGRLYFGTGGDYEKDEREKYEAKAEKDPDNFIAVDDFSSTLMLAGKTYVVDCPCNGPWRYEEWVWGQRFRILKYIQARSRIILDDAVDLKKLLDEVIEKHDKAEATVAAQEDRDG